jgi:hypothetical protein
VGDQMISGPKNSSVSFVDGKNGLRPCVHLETPGR